MSSTSLRLLFFVPYSAQELEKELQSPTAESLPAEKKLTIFDKLFTAYHDARNTIRSDLVSAGNAESVKDDLNGLDKAVGAVLGQRTIERNQLLVKVAKSKLNRKRDDKNDKVTRPEELVRLYDLLLQNVADLSDLISSGRDRKPEEIAFEEECQRTSLAFRAERCFYLAKSYSLAGKRAEAFALYSRARSLAEDALNKFQSIAKKDEGTIQELKTLIKECRANSCIEHATGIMEEERAPENLSNRMSTISLNNTAAQVEEKYLLDKLDVYESAVGDSNTKTAPKIERFPPALQSIPRNPIVLDLAYNCIDFPVIENRMKKKGGFFSSRISSLW